MSPDFPLTPLARPLESIERAALSAELSQLLRWQRELRRWPKLKNAPDASPIVSLYARGSVRGCWAVTDGEPGERLARAFLSALADLRYGGISADERPELVLQLSYATRARRLSHAALNDGFVAGVHGLALAPGDAPPVLLLPDVARDEQLDTEGFVSVLERKAALARAKWPHDGLFAFETESLVARAKSAKPSPLSSRDAAARWLVHRIAADGSVPFGLDPRSGAMEASGLLRHARAAVAIQALACHPLGGATAARARLWLAGEIDLGLSGHVPLDWPAELPHLAGTLALAALAGVERFEALLRLAHAPEVSQAPWHAAQLVAALGRRAPESLWQACVKDLDTTPYAPWTAIAAHRRADEAVFSRAVSGLVATVPRASSSPEGRGFVSEPALAALSIEALALSNDATARAACQAALELLSERQLWGDTHPAADPSWVNGAFPLSPVADFLRVDVTGHALLALTAAGE